MKLDRNPGVAAPGLTLADDRLYLHEGDRVPGAVLLLAHRPRGWNPKSAKR